MRLLALIFTTVLFFSAGCASRYQVMSDYRDMVRDNHPDRVNRATTVLFLVDGLSHLVLKRELQRNPRGALAQYFAARADSIPSAFAPFPSETYPGITTLLTGLPVDQHGVSGNRILVNGNEVNFERPQPAKELEKLLWDKTVFARLVTQNQLGVSLSYNFTTQAAAALDPDVRAGIAYARERYDRVDERTLRALEILLNRAEPKHWPDFVFVHLIGLDAISHDQGPDSPEAARYLQWLDGALAPALMRLQRAESQGHAVRTALTADHGFEAIRNATDLRLAARFYQHKFDDFFTAVVMPRYAALHLKSPIAATALPALIAPLSRVPLFDGVAIRMGDEIHYESLKVRLKIALRSADCPHSTYKLDAFDLKNQKSVTGGFVCPEALEYDNRGRMERIISLQLAAYFQGTNAPNAVVFAAPGTSFVKDGAGQHGGLSPREMEIPLLMRNVRSGASPGSAVALRRVLSDVAARPARPAHLATADAVTLAATEAPPALPVRRQLAIGTPSGLNRLKATFSSDSSDQTWDSAFSPGISLEYSEKWSRRVGWLARYEVGFTSLSTERFTQHRFGVGPFYRFHDGFALHGRVGAGQHFFGESDETLARTWIPEIAIGSPFRLMTLPIGDLNGMGELTAILPQESAAVSRAGYRESLMISFDQPIRTWDVLSWFAQLEHETIPYSKGEMTQISTKFGITYRIAF